MSTGGTGKREHSDDQPRRSKREKSNKKNTYNWVDSWTEFDALQRDVGDGVPECVATIYWIFGKSYGNVKGATKSGRGHAEIDCLCNLVDLCSEKQWDLNTFFSEGIFEVSCENKSCCWRCSAVLGALGVTADEKTFKTTKSMLGGGNWAIPHSELKKLLCDRLNIKEEVLNQMANRSGNL
jgi:hypothetical protein